MILRDWMKREGVNRLHLSKRIGCSPQNVYNIFNGKQLMSQKIAVKIEELTKGEVSRAEAMWPEQYVETMEDGSEQLVMNLQKVRNKSKF